MPNRDQIWSGIDGSQKPDPGWEIDEGHLYAPNRMAYLLNEGSGNHLNDLVRGSFGKGTFTNGPYAPWSIGNAGAALTFQQKLAVNARLQFAGANFGVMSWFAMWVYPMGVGSPTYQTLLANSGGTRGLYYRGDTHKLDLVYTIDHFSAAALPTNRWSLVLVNALGDASSTVQLVINGQLDSTFTGWPGFAAIQAGDDGGDFFTGLIESAFGSDGVSLPAEYWVEQYNNSYEWLVPPAAHRYDFSTVATPTAVGPAKKWFPGMDRRWLRQHRPGRMR
jgi:hypothetical protein